MGQIHSRALFIAGGVISSAILVLFGIGCIWVGWTGRQDVRDTLAEENIVGTPDSSIPGQLVDTGSEAKAFADVMREHTLASTGGLTYSELPRFLDEDGEPTNDTEAAAKDEFGNNVANPQRDLWITETALTTALNTAYFAEQVGNFAMLVGAALLLTGVGFTVLTLGALRRPPEPATT